jgi:oligopeptidase A
MLSFTLNHLSQIPQQLKQLLENQQSQFQSFLESQSKPNYLDLISLLERLENELHLFWSPISHLHSVMNTDELNESYEQCLALLSQHNTWLSHHQKLFHAFEYVANSVEFHQLKPVQKKYITDSLRDFKRAGVHLAPEQKKQFAEISQQLSQLSYQYEQNLMHATDDWQLHLDNVQMLQGLPDTAIALLRQNAEQAGQTGYLLNLQAPCFSAIVTHAADRELRKKIYEAWITRASEVGPSSGKFDNTKIMYDILNLKYQLAQLLGFSDYATYSLETKMANNPKTVDEFLNKLLQLARPFAEKEFAQLKKFAETLGVNELEPWDVAYVSEHLQKQTLDFDSEQLRPYFPLPVVLKGLFEITGKLFNISFKPAPQLPRWHDDVEAYEVQNEQGQTVAYFYLDLYARSKKRGGAWMDEAQPYWYSNDGVHQKPITFLCGNFSPPISGEPALLSHDDLVTLFHEFGHGLHHMLTQVEVLGLSGTRVEHDAVELPSQLLENWCWQAECLEMLSQHYQSKEELPHDLIDSLLESKNFLSGLFLLRQLEFALFDLRVHWKFDPSKGAEQIQEILNQVRKEVAVVPISPLNRFQNGFSHIFAGGYSAGYYSYLWAEVLSADAFSFFEKEGLLSTSAGAHFKKNILSQGGAESAAVLFERFRGRPPEIEALLKSYGLPVA